MSDTSWNLSTDLPKATGIDMRAEWTARLIGDQEEA